MQKQKVAKTLSKDFCLILCQILQNAESALLCHYERSICEAKNLKKISSLRASECERGNPKDLRALRSNHPLCGFCDFLQGGLPRFCFAESRKDEIFLPRFCESALFDGLVDYSLVKLRGTLLFAKAKRSKNFE